MKSATSKSMPTSSDYVQPQGLALTHSIEDMAWFHTNKKGLPLIIWDMRIWGDLLWMLEPLQPSKAASSTRPYPLTSGSWSKDYVTMHVATWTPFDKVRYSFLMYLHTKLLQNIAPNNTVSNNTFSIHDCSLSHASILRILLILSSILLKCVSNQHTQRRYLLDYL